MKKIGILFCFLILLTSCESKQIREGRKAYKEYYFNTLKDPESFKLYKEEVLKSEYNTPLFIIDYGAKNSYGAYVRSVDTIMTTGKDFFWINGNKYEFPGYAPW